VSLSESEQKKMVDISLEVRKQLIGKLYKKEYLQTVETLLAEVRKENAAKASSQ